MAEENIDIEVTGFKSLKAQIREAQLEYQRLIDTVGTTPAAIDAAARKVAELRDRFDDANDAVNSFTGAGKFQAVTKSLGAVAGGFTAIQGAISLAGGDAKDFEKTFQRVQGAMALTQGLTALEDLGNAFGNLKKVAVTAFNAIKTAIGSTGIGLLVIALGAIYAYWDDIKAVVSGVDEEQKQLNADSAANLALQEKQLNAISAQENILRLQGKSEEEIYQMKLDQYDATIKTAKVNLQNLEVTEKKQIEAAQRNKDILQGIIRFLTAPLALLLKTVDMVGKALGQDFGLEEKFSGGLAKLVFDPEEVKKEGDKTIEEAKTALTKLENERAGMILQHDAKRDAEQKAREEKAAAARQKEEDAQKTHLEKIRDLQDQYGELALKDEDARTLLALEHKQKKEQDELNLLIKGYEDKKNRTAAEEETLRILRRESDALKIKQEQETVNALMTIEEKNKKKKEENEKAVREFLANSAYDRRAIAEMELQATRDKLDKEAAYTYDTYRKIKVDRIKDGETQQIEIYKKISNTVTGKLKEQIIEEEFQRKLKAIDLQYAEEKYAELDAISTQAEDDRRKKAFQAANDVLEDKKSTDQDILNAERVLNEELRQIEEDAIRARIKAAKDLGLNTVALQEELNANLKEKYEEDKENWAQSFIKKNEVALEQLQGVLTAATSVIGAISDFQKLKDQEDLEATKAKYDGQQEALDAKYAADIAAAQAAGQETNAIEDEYAYQSQVIEYNRANEEYKQGKDGFERNKGVQIAQAIIGAIQGSVQAFTSLAGIPIVGPALGAIAAAAALASGYAQVALIRKSTYTGKPPKAPERKAAPAAGGAGGEVSAASKFANGGLLTGPKHDEGGIMTPFGQLEGGEYVVNRDATQAFLPLLEKINSMGSGSGALNNLSSSAESVINQERQQQIVKAYVVASEVASQLEAQKRIADIARL
jgi:hypothetical protein